MATHKALCVVTRCATVDDFVDMFRAFCDGPTLFVATKVQRPVGLETPFSFLLADRTPVLSGVGVVRESFTTSENAFRRPGLRLELSKLTPDSVAVHGRLTPAKQPPATGSIDAPTIPRASSSPRISTNPGVATSPRASTSSGVATKPRASTSPGVATSPRVSTNPRASTSPGVAASPRASTSPAVATSPFTSNVASSKTTPRSGTPKVAHEPSKPGFAAATPSNGTPLFSVDDFDLFDQTAPLAIIGDDGSMPLVDMSAGAPPLATSPLPDAQPRAASPSAASIEQELEPELAPAPAPASVPVATAGRARTIATETPAPRAEPAAALRAEPAAASRTEPAARVSPRRQMIGVGVLCALGGAAVTLATMRMTGGSEPAATTVAHRTDVGARHRAQPARKASVDVRTTPRAMTPPATHAAGTAIPSAAPGGVAATAVAPAGTAATGAAPAAATPPTTAAPASSPPAAAPTAAVAPAGARCKLSIAATPSDSEIRVGDRVLGGSPATYSGDCASLVVEVSHARYATSTQTVAFDAGTLSKTLAVQLSRPMHQVEVVSSPPGAAITIAGRVVGTTPAVVEMKGFSSVDVIVDKPGVGRTTVNHYSRKPVDRLSVTLGK